LLAEQKRKHRTALMALDQLWLFIVAPIIGGILAAILWRYAFSK